ncbi:hypothetical protein [Streptomyces sp. NPDC127033]|uniref:hypothetical protein n=1 Tax=Streptomyces sp. NPDC127033 TaxID=3347110 RepID=UPI0036664A6B
MSEHPEHSQPPADATATATAASTRNERGGRGRGGPEPEAIVFFGTTWLARDAGYAARRVAVALGSLTTAVAACFVLRFAYEGLEIAKVGSFVGLLLVVMLAVCSAIAFRRTWDGFTRRPADPAHEESLRSVKAIGFMGSLIAYFLRSLAEAPGEGLRRKEYETALAQYERRRTARAGNPAARAAAKEKGKGRNKGGNKGGNPQRA